MFHKVHQSLRATRIISLDPRDPMHFSSLSQNTMTTQWQVCKVCSIGTQNFGLKSFTGHLAKIYSSRHSLASSTGLPQLISHVSLLCPLRRSDLLLPLSRNSLRLERLLRCLRLFCDRINHLHPRKLSRNFVSSWRPSKIQHKRFQ